MRFRITLAAAVIAIASVSSNAEKVELAQFPCLMKKASGGNKQCTYKWRDDINPAYCDFTCEGLQPASEGNVKNANQTPTSGSPVIVAQGGTTPATPGTNKMTKPDIWMHSDNEDPVDFGSSTLPHVKYRGLPGREDLKSPKMRLINQENKLFNLLPNQSKAVEWPGKKLEDDKLDVRGDQKILLGK